MNEKRNAVTDAKYEYVKASLHYGSFCSAHEGYAILLEEVEELWDAVKLKQSDLSRPEKMRKEATQIAAMALRFLHDVCGEEITP